MAWKELQAFQRKKKARAVLAPAAPKKKRGRKKGTHFPLSEATKANIARGHAAKRAEAARKAAEAAGVKKRGRVKGTTLIAPLRSGRRGRPVGAKQSKATRAAISRGHAFRRAEKARKAAGK